MGLVGVARAAFLEAVQYDIAMHTEIPWRWSA
jgi:hypothetical protein